MEENFNPITYANLVGQELVPYLLIKLTWAPPLC